MTEEVETYLTLDAGPYEGHWIALLGNAVVAHGKDLRAVYAEALERHPGTIPLFTKVPESDETLIL